MVKSDSGDSAEGPDGGRFPHRTGRHPALSVDERIKNFLERLHNEKFPVDPASRAAKLRVLLEEALKFKEPGLARLTLATLCLWGYLDDSFVKGTPAEKVARVKLMMDLMDRLDEERGNHDLRGLSGEVILCEPVARAAEDMNQDDQKEFLDQLGDSEKSGLGKAALTKIKDVLSAQKMLATDFDPQGLKQIEDPERRQSVEKLLLDAGRLDGLPEYEKMARYYFSADSAVPDGEADGQMFFRSVGIVSPQEIGRVIVEAPPGRKRDMAIMGLIQALKMNRKKDQIPEWIERIGDADLREEAGALVR